MTFRKAVVPRCKVVALKRNNNKLERIVSASVALASTLTLAAMATEVALALASQKAGVF